MRSFQSKSFFFIYFMVQRIRQGCHFSLLSIIMPSHENHSRKMIFFFNFHCWTIKNPVLKFFIFELRSRFIALSWKEYRKIGGERSRSMRRSTRVWSPVWWIWSNKMKTYGYRYGMLRWSIQLLLQGCEIAVALVKNALEMLAFLMRIMIPQVCLVEIFPRQILS